MENDKGKKIDFGVNSLFDSFKEPESIEPEFRPEEKNISDHLEKYESLNSEKEFDVNDIFDKKTETIYTNNLNEYISVEDETEDSIVIKSNEAINGAIISTETTSNKIFGKKIAELVPNRKLFIIAGSFVLVLIIIISITSFANNSNTDKSSVPLNSTTSANKNTETATNNTKNVVINQTSKENILYYATDAFYKHYLSYIKAINAQSDSLLIYCTSAQFSNFSQRVFNNNADNTYQSISIKVDINSFKSWDSGGIKYASFTSKCENKQFVRASGSQIDNNIAFHVVTVQYDNSLGHWVVSNAVWTNPNELNFSNNIVELHDSHTY